ncbi:MAG: hypothetical protein HY332_03805 [Chloroflexi bacterium]|nr:hypothetical protein [Chloroflexota bacterium]
MTNSGIGPLRAGYAALDITPPAGIDLTGFIARRGPCTGVLDPLEARALVFEGARARRAALVTCDLIGLGRHMVARVRRRVAAATGIAPEAQLFNCSHTHSGPETGVLTTIGIPDPAYLAGLEDRLAGSVIEAARALEPVRLRIGTVDVSPGLVLNRVYRRAGRPEAYDPQLTVVRLERAAGQAGPLATIVAFACHAVALGSGERGASADYVAPLRTHLEAAGAGPVLYVNGCGGDVNPAGMDARGREARDALGLGLAQAALAALGQAVDVEASTGGAATVAAAQEWAPLRLQRLRSPGEASKLLAAGKERLSREAPGSPGYRGTMVTHIDYPLRLLRLHYGNEQPPVVTAEVQAIRFGPVAVVALPGEIFSSLGRTIKRTSPFAAPRTLVAGWSNDNVGYVPDRDAYPLGGYEVDSASRYYGFPAGWAPEAGDTLVAAARRALDQVVRAT